MNEFCLTFDGKSLHTRNEQPAIQVVLNRSCILNFGKSLHWNKKKKKVRNTV